MRGPPRMNACALGTASAEHATVSAAEDKLLGGRDSNPDSQDQNLVSCRWTTPQRAGHILARRADLRSRAPRGAPWHAPAFRARLRGGAARGGDAEHAHRLQTEAELLAAVAGADVEARELAHALEPVVDRVAVREQSLCGAGDVAVRLEKGLERAHEIGLVLLVVGDERLHGLRVEALQLAGVLAHRRKQQAVGAGLLERE